MGTELEELTAKIKVCDACHLKETRTQVVPGIYGPKNSLCIVGEAPGFNEDKEGFPFVGRSGKLLDKMLENVGFSRNDISIFTVIYFIVIFPPKRNAFNVPKITFDRQCRNYIIQY